MKGAAGSSGTPLPAPLLFLCQALATGLYLSYLPAAFFKRSFWTGAGLVGTLWGLALLPWLPENPAAYAGVVALASLAAVPVCAAAGRTLGKTDDPRIVLDETLGFWAAAAFLPRDPWHLGVAFLLFRVFDVFKPPPVRALERLPGGLGVVMDDLAAGVLACLLLHAWDGLAPLLPLAH